MTTDDEDGADRIRAGWRRELPDVPVGPIGVITRIWRLAQLFTADRERTLDRLGLDSSTLDLLSTLRRSGPPYELTSGQIAARSFVSAGAVSQRIARAEAAGLVRRARSGADGRSVAVRLTDEGRRMNEDAVADLLRHEETLLDGLGATEHDELAATLKVLLGQLTRRFDAEDRPPP
ncbi:DNA-binding MarR family transcriptional regulator [Haloactinopolyspora alba]|uniref:DNA-binding MarR family transcriptional regulator n=1 Tax=Haloactinopolyspora alba TaxID=648780 RepID=A0A2P8DVC6_9ACTN|nr:MarR family transcriptional regulator [Haloactinopolyspora alba]PSL01166.1 DNA-binding MarR family transcriptional regulator [Haloactinopolyspora alba]